MHWILSLFKLSIFCLSWIFLEVWRDVFGRVQFETRHRHPCGDKGAAGAQHLELGREAGQRHIRPPEQTAESWSLKLGRCREKQGCECTWRGGEGQD